MVLREGCQNLWRPQARISKAPVEANPDFSVLARWWNFKQLLKFSSIALKTIPWFGFQGD